MKEAVQLCKRAGINLLHRNHKITAAAIAEELGILAEGDGTVTGASRRHGDEELRDRVKTYRICRVAPQHKVRIVKA